MSDVIMPVSEVMDGCVDDDEDVVLAVYLNITLNFLKLVYSRHYVWFY